MLTELSFHPVSLPSLAHHDADRIETQSRTRGHAAGYAAGLRAAEKERLEQRAACEAEHAEVLRAARASVESALTALAAAIRSADARMLPVLQASDDTLAAAALDLAEAVLGHELADGDRSARAALGRALGAVPTAELTSIRMNPGDLALIDPELRASAGVDLVADGALHPGDALALLPDGYVDARIGTALARARAALLGGDS
ncbi:MAG: FliH/SctL family protein [Mycetocola sp.]